MIDRGLFIGVYFAFALSTVISSVASLWSVQPSLNIYQASYPLTYDCVPFQVDDDRHYPNFSRIPS
jgi:hypothetical protein